MEERRRSALAAGVAGAVAAALVCSVFAAAGAFDDGAPGGRRADRPATPTAATASVGDVYRRVRAAVVLIDHRPPGVKPRQGPPRRDDGIATGSGFVIDRRGHVVTNQHVVAGRGTTTVQLDAGGDPVKATIVGRDASTDLALVRVDRAAAGRLRPLALGDSRAVRVGDTAIAIGNPFGLERSLSVGVVSGVDRRIEAPDGSRMRGAVQTDAPINPGSSGGPLLDAAGRVIGVVSQARGQGIGFAVPVATLRRVVAELLRERRGGRRRRR